MKVARRLGVWGCVVAGTLALASVWAAELIRDMQGNGRSLDEFAGNGKWVILMIWASDCHIEFTARHDQARQN